nr:MAG TPA: hypothetical protein [Caudoviricetes sp.]
MLSTIRFATIASIIHSGVSRYSSYVQPYSFSIPAMNIGSETFDLTRHARS